MQPRAQGKSLNIATKTMNQQAKRFIRTGTGVTGVAVELSVSHVMNLMLLRDKAARLAIDFKERPQLVNIEKALCVLESVADFTDFIVRDDFTDPTDKKIWSFTELEKHAM